MPVPYLYRRVGSPGGYNGNGLTYLLLDQFDAAVAAGGLNGTNAIPTGGARVAVDSNNKISASGGTLNFATGETANDSVWYSGQTRTTGRVLIGVFNINTSPLRFGWDTNQSTTISTNAISFSSSTNINIIDSSTSAVIAVYAASTSYQIAIVLRAIGVYVFIKGGLFTKYNLIWVTNGLGDNTATIYPDITSNSTTAVATIDDVRIPQGLFMPTPIAYDTFTRADGALGNSETTGPDSQAASAKSWTGSAYTISTNKAIATPALGSDVVVNGAFAADTDWNKGAGWTISGGLGVSTAASSDITAAVAPLTTGTWYQTAITIAGNAGGTGNVKIGTTASPTHNTNATFTETGRATSTALAVTATGWTATIDNFSAKALTLANLFASVVAATADVFAVVNVTLESATSGKQAGLVVNLDSTSSPANFIIIYLDGNGNCKADECVAGTYTNKLSAAVTYSAGAPLSASRSGTDLRVTYNGNAVGSLATMTANTNVNHGLFSTSPLSSLDVFLLYPKGTSNEFSALDIY